ncbi:MAG TPA: hypothetical protein ENN09_05440 [Planctomycetes bacterium]|nr:hypothetical protein [Planctomycetota bacterium]
MVFFKRKTCRVAGMLAVFAAIGACTLLRAESELEETLMQVGDIKVTLVKYRGEHYLKVPVIALEKPQYRNRLVCVEGKFDQMAGAQDNLQILKLYGSDVSFLYPFDAGLPGLIRGDNMWVGGVAESEPGKERLRVRVRGIVKLPNDTELFRQRYAAYSKAADWRQLINLGDWMGMVGKLNVGSFSDEEYYRREQRRAYRRALEMWAQQIGADDAESHYAISIKYLELLDDSIAAQRHLKRCLLIDPTHKAAQSRLSAFGWVQFENQWMTIAEMEREIRRRQDAAGGDTTGDAPVGVEPGVSPDSHGGGTPDAAAVQRLSQEALAAAKSRLIGLALSGKRPEVDVFVEEAGKATDPEFALFLLRLLSMRSEERALDGIFLLNALDDEEVRKAVIETLLWRPEKRAFETFLATVEKTRSASAARRGLDLLALVEPAKSYPAFIKLLDAESELIRGEVQQRLRKLTGERFEKPAEWRLWWEKAVKSYRP